MSAPGQVTHTPNDSALPAVLMTCNMVSDHYNCALQFCCARQHAHCSLLHLARLLYAYKGLFILALRWVTALHSLHNDCSMTALRHPSLECDGWAAAENNQYTCMAPQRNDGMKRTLLWVWVHGTFQVIINQRPSVLWISGHLCGNAKQCSDHSKV